MKIIFSCNLPFMFTHGGQQIQIEQTKAALEHVGVTVEPLRWWDDAQNGDVLHHFGRIPTHHLLLAQKKGMKVVVADLLTGQGSRSPARLRLQRFVTRFLTQLSSRRLAVHFGWESYRLADACLALTSWEAKLMSYLFDAPREKVFVVPNGAEEIFLNSRPLERGPWLICTATITPRKRILELAQAAVKAQTPLWVIGRAYSDSDDYAREFFNFAKQNSKIIRFEGAITDRAELTRAYRQARGFVLLSTMESLSLSALEAAACECPLLLSDLPWARSVFDKNAMYCPIMSATRSADLLRRFYDCSPGLPAPPRPLSWNAVAGQLVTIYASLLERRT